jgi:hypothetical protein
VYPEDDGLDILLDFVGAYQRREWLLFFGSLLLWCAIVVLLLCMAPFALIGALWGWGKKISLKLRKKAADKLRPKDVVRARHTEPQSDLVAAFCEYELSLVVGKETPAARSKLISQLAHVEQELEEHRILAKAISTLRKEEARPNRREAVLSTRARGVRRRRREEGEQE